MVIFNELSENLLLKLSYFYRLGKENVTDVLLKNGANINTVDFQGRTALHLCAEIGKFQNVL